MVQIYMSFFAWFTSILVPNVLISSQQKLCCYNINEKSKKRLEKESILQYIRQDAVTFRRHLGFGLTRRKKFLQPEWVIILILPAIFISLD